MSKSQKQENQKMSGMPKMNEQSKISEQLKMSEPSKMNDPSKMNKPPKRTFDPTTFRRLMHVITSEYKWQFLAVVICIFISAGASVLGSMFIRSLVDDYIQPLLLVDNPVFTGLLQAIMLMALVYVVGITANLIFNRIMVVISQGVQKRVRDQMFSHMQTLPIRYFDTNSHGDLMSRFTNDTDTLRQLISQSIPQFLNSIITIVSVAVAMLVQSIPLSALVAVCVVVMLVAVKQLGSRSGSYFMRQQKAIGDLNGYIEEMMNGQKVVKVFCHEEATKETFDKKNDFLCEQATAANTFAIIIMPIMGNLGNIQYVLVALLGGLMAINGFGGVTLGMIAAFLMLSKSFSQPIAMISQQMNSIIMALAGAERIFNLLDEKPEEDEGYVTLVNAEYRNGVLTECEKRTKTLAWKHPHQADGSITYTELKGKVELFDVDFGYVPEKMVLHNVSLYAKEGQKLAFVGATGAGKTTITNLINRFYDIADGKIRFDGININKIKKRDLRHALGMVLQDTNLFTETIAENIRYGKLDATREEIEQAAKRAGAHDFIMRLPDGYETVITGGGSNLSQGQRQLLSIARATVCDPPVMILDEATSSIDTRTEAIVQKGMDSLMEGRTVFVIAHRLSTIRNSNAIMVLEQGQIIERGDHEALLEQRGKYYQLYTGAFAE